MKKKRVIVALVVLVIVAAAAGGYFILKAKRNSASRTGTGTGMTRTAVYTVGNKDVATSTTVSGTVTALRSATLTAKAAGAVTAVYVKEGDKVTAGEVIARIDSTTYESDLAAAESQYSTTIINLETADTTDLAATKAQLEAAVQQAQIQELQAENSLKSATVYDTSAETAANLQEQVTEAEESLATAQDKLTYLRNYDTSASTGPDVAVQQAQLNLTTAENQLVTIAQDPKSSQSAIDAQTAQVNSARLALENANANAEASKTAADASTAQRILDLNTDQLQVTQAERAVTKAKNDLAGNQKTVDAQANNVEVLKADVDQAKASVATAKANLAAFPETVRKYGLQLQANEQEKKQALISLNAEKQLGDNYVVKAPWAGTITALNVVVGDDTSTATAKSVATITDASGYYVSTYVDEVDILNVKNGEDASVTMDEYAGKTFAGKVTYVAHSLSTTSNSVSAYPVRIDFTNPPTTLVAGMSADAAITVSVTKGVLAVPVAAILSENGKTYVDVITFDTAKKSTTTSKVEVKTGVEGDTYTQITSGLKAGDRILAKASTTMTTGSTTTSSRGAGSILGGFGGAGPTTRARTGGYTGTPGGGAAPGGN
jgi:HlyD family secretion protein